MSVPTAAALEAALQEIAVPENKPDVARFFYGGLGETQVLGVSIGRIFPIAKAHRDLSLAEIDLLLDSRFYEIRMAAAAVMDFQARQKKAVNPLAALYELYLSRHDRLDNWGFVDRAAPFVVGQYLADKSRAPLYDLARSADPWRRRTAIVATYYFIRQGDVADTFAIGAMLAADSHPMVQKAVGSWVRTAGDRAPEGLIRFLEKSAGDLPRPVFRTATKNMDPGDRARFG